VIWTTAPISYFGLLLFIEFTLMVFCFGPR
jgi:hypothetical protein